MGIDFRALAITVLLAFALYFTYGQFSLPWITVLPLVLAFAVYAFPTPRWFLRSRSLVSLTIVLFFLAVSAASLLPESEWLRSMIVDVADQSYLPWMRVLFGAAALGTIALYFGARFAFPFVLACMIAAFALIIPTSPRPQIDVWTVHEEGAQAFVEGRNPYTHEYTNIYSEELRPYLTPGGVTFSYLPGVFMWMAPWKALGLDTRYSQLITRLCTALLLVLIARRATGRRDFASYVPALLFLTFPLNTFFIVRAWNDDISMMCYALAAYGMISRKPWALFIATNFLLLHKQHAIFFVPILIWFAWRAWNDKWAWLKGTAVAAAVGSAYLIADWRNFLGSLYGLTFLKFPNIHTVFLERRDPYSLMNYLQLFAGYRNGWFFLVVLLVMGFFVVRRNWRKPDAASVLRGLGAMCLAMFVFAPIAFANYYQFALGLILIGAAAGSGDEQESWEPTGNVWTLSYIAVRSVILFNFNSIIVETRLFAEQADKLISGRSPEITMSLIPSWVAAQISLHGKLQEFLSFHTLFQLSMLVCDVVIAWVVFRRANEGRVSKLALATYVFAPLLVGYLWFTSPVLFAAMFVWFVIAAFERPFRTFVKDRFDQNREALIVFLTGAAITIAIFGAEVAGFEVGYQKMISPTHALIWLIALLPVCPPLRPLAFRRFTVPLFAAAFVAALSLTTYFFISFESVYTSPEKFSTELILRNVLIALAALFLALSLRKGRSA